MGPISAQLVRLPSAPHAAAVTSSRLYRRCVPFFSTSSSHLLGFCGFSRWVAWVCLSFCRVDFFLFFFFFKYQSQPTQFVRDFSPPSSLFGSLCARIILLLIVNSECASQPIHREKEKKKEIQRQNQDNRLSSETRRKKEEEEEEEEEEES